MAAKEVTILGAGPAGLGAALELKKLGVSDVLVLDQHAVAGGLSRTLEFEDHRFDVGPHRFFTKSPEINAMWHEILGEAFQPVSRLTRIYYKQTLFNYPLKPVNALTKLGLVDSAQAIASYMAMHLRHHNGEAENFEDWVSRQFGRKLFEVFFKTYTEKVWGIDCKEIAAEWASQRIKGLSLKEAVLDAINPFNSAKKAKSLVEEFDYPEMGAGQMYEAMASAVADAGGVFQFDTRVTALLMKDNRVRAVRVEENGRSREIPVETLFTSIPLTLAVQMIEPAPPAEILEHVQALYYRDHVTVNLIVEGAEHFPDQWIYVHSPDVKMGRLANYNNFSKKMASPATSALSVEYFTFQDDEVWGLSDEDLIQLAIDELDYMKLVPRHKVKSGMVIRETEAYPTYYVGYEQHYEPLKAYLESIDNLQCIGRGGMYKYNNQDHSIITGMLAARNYRGSQYNIWDVNIDGEYQEGSQRDR